MKKVKFFLFGGFLTVSHLTYALDIGVGIHPRGFSGTPEQLISTLKKYNIKSFRTDYFWEEIEKSKGNYKPANLKIESTIQLARRNGIEPLIIYDYGNQLYDNKTTLNPRSKPQSDVSKEAFLSYVQWSTSHLKNDVSMFEIWNEWVQMDGRHNKELAISDNSAKNYAQLALNSCRIIKKINPKAIVIAGGTSPLDIRTNAWLMKIINYGILDCIDGISLHPYNFKYNQKLDYGPIISAIKALQLEVKYSNNGKAVPFYITETGVPNINQSSYNLQDTANYFTGYMQALSKLDYVKGVWWYDFINDGNDQSNPEHNFGILNKDLSPKPIALKFADTIKKYK